MLPSHLSSIQQHLEHMYALKDLPAVGPFVCTDVDLANCFQSNSNSPLSILSEQLFIQENQDELLISLYLDEHLLHRVEAANPYECILNANLSEYCLVLEGVSHFLYLLWHSQKGRSVRAVEMELQSEVDKFFGILTLCGAQTQAVEINGLIDWLFCNVTINPRLPVNLKQRYLVANHYAHKYCLKSLRENLDSSGLDRRQLFKNLRQFYRLNFAQKVAYLS